jgi:hypothetical protein
MPTETSAISLRILYRDAENIPKTGEFSMNAKMGE